MKNILITLCFLFVASLGYSQLKVAADGKVGIGINAPVTNLHVEGVGATTGFRVGRSDFDANVLCHSASGNPQFRFSRTGTTYAMGNRAGRFHFQPLANIGTTATGLFVDASGNLGVGVVVPSYALHVNGDAAKPGGGSWTVASDKRLKNNVRDFEDGLEKVLEINPVYFTYNGKAGIKDVSTEHVGIIAQEFVKIAPYAERQFNYSKIETITDEEGNEIGENVEVEEYLAVDPSSLPYLLVNAIKDQQALIEDLQGQIETLKELIANTGRGDQSIVLQGEGKAFLSQNMPNPYSDITQIDYELPESAQSGKIQFFNMSGQLIKTVDVTDRVGTITVEANELPSGTYSYSLIVDNQQMATKKMIYTK